MSADDHYMEGEMAYISDDLDTARTSFQRALEMEPEVSDAYQGRRSAVYLHIPRCFPPAAAPAPAAAAHPTLLPPLQNAEYLDGYGAFLAECGPRAEAIAVLQRACDLAPNHGFEKFM